MSMELIKPIHRDTKQGDYKVGSSDIDLECNVVVLEDLSEKFTRSTSERFEVDWY